MRLWDNGRFSPPSLISSPLIRRHPICAYAQAERRPYHYYTKNRENVDNQDGLQHNYVMAKRLFRTTRKPQSAKPVQSPHHPPTTYPDQQTWRRIVFQRDQILRQLIAGSVGNVPDVVTRLVSHFGTYEVGYVLQRYQGHIHTSFLTDETAVYRHYRLLFAQFGGNRPFLSKRGLDAAITKETKNPNQLRRMLMGMSGPDDVFESDRLTHLSYATDITPPAIPPQPVNFKAPKPGDYSPQLTSLLNLGWQLDEAAMRMMPDFSQEALWRNVLPELSQMAVDPGLVNGWPGQPASWAPYHALTVLGHLQATAFAAALLPLISMKDDWLSDRLPDIWAQMGPVAALPLWEMVEKRAYPDKKLAILVAGLLKIAQTDGSQVMLFGRRFIDLLNGSPAKHANLNAYLVYALDELGDNTAVPAIRAAFNQNRVNRDVIGPESIKLLGGGLG